MLKLLALFYTFASPYSWDHGTYRGVGVAIEGNGQHAVSIESFDLNRKRGKTCLVGIAFHPSCTGYTIIEFPYPKPYRFKPRHTPGTLEGF